MQPHRIILAGLLSATGTAFAQQEPKPTLLPNETSTSTPSLLERFEKWGLRLRRHVRGSNGINDPAIVQFTHGSGADDDSAVLQAGLAWDAWSSTRWLVSPFGEVNRNTDIKNEVESYQVGASVTNVTGDPQSFLVHTQADLAYKKVPTSDTEGSQVALGLTLVSPGLFLNTTSGPGPVRFAWDLMPGVVWENNHLGADGDEVRGTVLARVRLFPWSKPLDDRLTITGSIQYWRDLSGSGTFDDGSDEVHASILRLDYALDAEKRLGIGLEYFEGQDPDAGIKDTEYLQVSLTVKF